MASRAVPVQKLPPDDLAGFPRYRYRPGLRLWRAALTDKRPWWYCDKGDCRFDLTSPLGTCYMGTDELVGIIEAVGPHLKPGDVIASEFLDARVLWEWPLGAALNAANLVTRSASGFGVTNELCSMTSYHVPRAWARALQGAGHEAVRYRTRFDTGATPRGVAHFGVSGDAGERAGEQSHKIADEVRARLADECSLKVAPPPSLSELEVASTP